MSSEPLDGAPIMYDPVDLGHLHDKAEEQVTGTFHWQCPNWARPGYHLYYYQDYGYFDHPLYTTTAPNGSKVVTSYGNGQRFNNPPMAEPPEILPKHAKLEMVDVYNVDEFVEEVSLRLLTRFSSVARVTFSKSGKKRRVKPGSEHTERSTLQLGTLVDSVVERASCHLEETTHGVSKVMLPAESPRSTASEAQWSARTRSDTRTTELTVPDEVETPPRVQSGQGLCRRHHSPQHIGGPNTKKELRLDNDAAGPPTTRAIREAIAWMKSKGKRHGDQTLLYGADDLTKLSLEDLINLYQAAEAFGMRPWPARLKLELNERLTRTKLDYQIFRDITRRPPLADSCLSRAINQLGYHTFEGCYTDAEVKIPGSTHCQLQGAINPTDQSPRRYRRRARRRQQSEGKSHKGTVLPGANYE